VAAGLEGGDGFIRGRVAADPYYENVSALYNRLSRLHGETLASLGSTPVEPQQVTWHAEASWTWPFSSSLGLAATYQANSVQVQRPYAGTTDHSSYAVQDIALGLPLDLFQSNLRLIPWIGGLVSGNGLFEKTGSVTASGDLFGVYAAEPYAKLDVAGGAFNALYLNGSLRWGRQLETLDPARGTALYDASEEANLTTLLSFIDVWPLRDTSLRTYGKIDYITTAGLAWQNTIYTAVQEITVNHLREPQAQKCGLPLRVLLTTPTMGGRGTSKSLP
jgi:hypothetical protein